MTVMNTNTQSHSHSRETPGLDRDVGYYERLSAVSAGAPTSADSQDQLQSPGLSVSVSRDPAPPTHRCHECHECHPEFLCPCTRVFIFTKNLANWLPLCIRVSNREKVISDNSIQQKIYDARWYFTPVNKLMTIWRVIKVNWSIFILSDVWLFLVPVPRLRDKGWQPSEDISHCHRMSQAWK